MSKNPEILVIRSEVESPSHEREEDIQLLNFAEKGLARILIAARYGEPIAALDGR